MSKQRLTKKEVHIRSKHRKKQHLKQHHVHQLQSNKKEEYRAEILEKYTVEADGAKVTIEIKREFLGTVYYLRIPNFDEHTTRLLQEMRAELIAITTVSTKELTDIEAFAAIKERFMQEAIKL